MAFPPELPDLIRTVSAFDTPTLSNAMEKLGLHRCATAAIRAVSGGGPVAGVAVTGTMEPQWGGACAHLEPWLEFLESIEQMRIPVIAVLHDASARPGADAMIGEGMSRPMRAAGRYGRGALRRPRPRRRRATGDELAGVGFGRDARPRRDSLPRLSGARRNRRHGSAPGRPHPCGRERRALVVPIDRASEIVEAEVKVQESEARLFTLFDQPAFAVSRLHNYYARQLAAAREEAPINPELPARSPRRR